MRHIFRLAVLCAGGSLLLLTGCTTARVAGGGPYHVTAYRPHDPSAVRVKVSLSTQNIYVLEGDRCLMAVACSVGISSKPTPKGSFKITQSRSKSVLAPMDLAYRAIALCPPLGADRDATSVIRWDIGANSRQRMGFIRALFTLIHARTAAFDCTVKRRPNSSRW